VKLLKHEIDLLPKDRRKEEFKHRKENLEREQKRRVSKPTFFRGLALEEIAC
jgi:hypothetical protein